jgi:hypothetical protein
MVITAYRQQEQLLSYLVDDLRAQRRLDHVDVEVCTLDRCQGREADYVLISLVRSRATPFLDMPKRWNVALTRAMKGLFIVGNIDAYLAEAANARRERYGHPGASSGSPRPARTGHKGSTGPLGAPARMHGGAPLAMHLLARIIEAYDRLIANYQRSGSSSDAVAVAAAGGGR